MNLSVLTQSPLEADFVQNPYPFYATARAAGPLFYWQDYGFVCAAQHSMANAVLRDRRFGRENPFPDAIPDHLRPFYDNEHYSMLEREPPTHTRLRRLVLHAFTSRRIAALEPEIRALADQLARALPQEGAFDLLPFFAERIPVIIICRLLGVPEEHADQLLHWSHDMVAMYQARRNRTIEDTAVRATQEFSAFLRDYIAERRRKPADDLLTQLIAAEKEGERLSEAELISTCILLLNAGHEATVHAIGNGVRAVLQSGISPQDALRSPALLAEEIFRFTPPLHMFTRYAIEPVEIAGHRFAPGEQIGVLLASANRDATVFDRPDTFDPTRNAKAQLSFGAGLHFCVGAPLARLELTASLPVLFQNCPKLHLAEDPIFADKYHFHGLERLMVCA